MSFSRAVTLRLAAACLGLLLAARAFAAELPFSASLSDGERTRAGLAKLTPAQVARLDALVAQDETLAREGGVSGFATAFSQRHAGREAAEAGLDRLDFAERSTLDTFAARAIALGPPPGEPFAYHPPKAVAPPTETEVAVPKHWEVHGDVSLTVGGASHGGSFTGTGADVVVFDPTRTFSLGVGFEEFRGKGLLPLCTDFGTPSPYLGW